MTSDFLRSFLSAIAVVGGVSCCARSSCAGQTLGEPRLSVSSFDRSATYLAAKEEALQRAVQGRKTDNGRGRGLEASCSRRGIEIFSHLEACLEAVGLSPVSRVYLARRPWKTPHLLPHHPERRGLLACFSCTKRPAMPPGPLFRYCDNAIDERQRPTQVTFHGSVRLTLYVHQTAKSTSQSCILTGMLPIPCARSQPTRQPCRA